MCKLNHKDHNNSMSGKDLPKTETQTNRLSTQYT